MRAWALLGLLAVACDGDKTSEAIGDTGAGVTDTDTGELDTVPDDTGKDSGTKDTGKDTGTKDTGTKDTGVADVDPCEGRKVGIDIGDCAMNFALVDADGTTHELHSYAGQVVMLDFSGFT